MSEIGKPEIKAIVERLSGAFRLMKEHELKEELAQACDQLVYLANQVAERDAMIAEFREALYRTELAWDEGLGPNNWISEKNDDLKKRSLEL